MICQCPIICVCVYNFCFLFFSAIAFGDIMLPRTDLVKFRDDSRGLHCYSATAGPSVLFSCTDHSQYFCCQ